MFMHLRFCTSVSVLPFSYFGSTLEYFPLALCVFVCTCDCVCVCVLYAIPWLLLNSVLVVETRNRSGSSNNITQ